MRSWILMAAAAAAAAAVLLSAPVAAQEWSGGDATLDDRGVTVPMFFADGINQSGEIGGHFNRAYFDAQSNEVLLEGEGGTYVVTFEQIIAEASRGDIQLAAQIRADFDTVFRSGGVMLGHLSADQTNVGLNGPRNYCNYVACESTASGWQDSNGGRWDLQNRPPPAPAPPPPPPQHCTDAVVATVEAGLAHEAFQACRPTNLAKGIWCAAVGAWSILEAARAAENARNCAAPPPPPPAPPRDLWGLGF